MRINAGKFRGRSLAVPAGSDVRPTSDRVRQALFNILVHGGQDLEGIRVVDVFAGSGALGLEALSRGASYGVFVETAAASRAAIRDNVEALGLGGVTRILKRGGEDLGPRPPQMAAFGLAFLDPPYGKGLMEPALAALASGGWLEPGATLVCEQRVGEILDPPSDYRLTDERLYGETVVRFLTFGG